MYILPVGGHALATSRQEIISLWNDNELGQGAIQLVVEVFMHDCLVSTGIEVWYFVTSQVAIVYTT